MKGLDFKSFFKCGFESGFKSKFSPKTSNPIQKFGALIRTVNFECRSTLNSNFECQIIFKLKKMHKLKKFFTLFFVLLQLEVFKTKSLDKDNFFYIFPYC